MKYFYWNSQVYTTSIDGLCIYAYATRTCTRMCMHGMPRLRWYVLIYKHIWKWYQKIEKKSLYLSLKDELYWIIFDWLAVPPLSLPWRLACSCIACHVEVPCLTIQPLMKLISKNIEKIILFVLKRWALLLYFWLTCSVTSFTAMTACMFMHGMPMLRWQVKVYNHLWKWYQKMEKSTVHMSLLDGLSNFILSDLT